MFFNYFQDGDLEAAEESTERVHKICKKPHTLLMNSMVLQILLQLIIRIVDLLCSECIFGCQVRQQYKKTQILMLIIERSSIADFRFPHLKPTFFNPLFVLGSRMAFVHLALQARTEHAMQLTSALTRVVPPVGNVSQLQVELGLWFC